MVLNVLLQGSHFQLVVTDTLRFELASTKLTSYQKFNLTCFFLFEDIFRNGFKLSNLALCVVNVELSQTVQFVTRDVLELESAAGTNYFFLLLHLDSRCSVYLHLFYFS